VIEPSKDTEQCLITSIKRFLFEKMDQEIGDLKASLFLKYALQAIGPHIYNKAVADTQFSMQSMETSQKHPSCDVRCTPGFTIGSYDGHMFQA